MVLWAVMNIVTRGGFDEGVPAVSTRLFELGQLLEVSWNLLLIPAALVLREWLRPKSPNLMLLYTVCGVASLLYWAYGGATQGITPILEVSYLLLSGVWWLGVGLVLRSERRALSTFTVILGLFALLDGVLSFLEPLPFYVYLTATPKLPLSIIWDFWIGVVLLRALAAQIQPGSSAAAEHDVGADAP
jgi:hypothetical protein